MAVTPIDPLLERPSNIFCKVESVKGVAETLTTTEGVFAAFDVEIKEATGYKVREKQGGAGKHPGNPTAKIGTAAFRINVENATAWADVLLPACGYIGSAGVYTRTLTTTSQKCLTIGHIKGAGATAVKQTICGACGAFKLVGHSGDTNDLLFNFTGIYRSEGTVTALNPTEQATNPPRGFVSHNIGGVQVTGPEFTTDFGQLVAMIEGANDSTDSGYLHAVVSDYNPTHACQPYQEALSVIDWRNKFDTRALMALAYQIGTGAGNIVSVAASEAQLTGSPEFGTRNRIYTRGLQFDINDEAGPTITLA